MTASPALPDWVPARLRTCNAVVPDRRAVPGAAPPRRRGDLHCGSESADVWLVSGVFTSVLLGRCREHPVLKRSLPATTTVRLVSPEEAVVILTMEE